MENISYVGLSAQMALQRQMDITANNIANMNTSGFKAQGVLFLDYLNKAKDGSGNALTQVTNFGTYRDLAAGSMTQTFNDLDFAIQGDGYFSIQSPEGTRYTRDGSFSLNANREIVTKDGFQVMGDGGPITIPSDATRIIVAKDGSVSTDKGSVDKIKIVGFDSEQLLTPTGHNLLDGSKATEKTIDKPHVEQGMVEASNVNPIVEMNRMVEILRAYQSTQQMLVTDHERMRSAFQRLTKI